MMVDKEVNLGLSLSLSLGASNFFSQIPRKPSSGSFTSSDPNSDSCRTETVTPRATYQRGFDVNVLPSTATTDFEEEAGVSSPNSTTSSVYNNKRTERELIINGSEDNNETERASSRGISDEEDGDTSRKKLRLSKDQSAILEESFKEHSTLNPKQKLALAKQLGLRPRQVEVWFQNRRARTKLKQTEVDCAYLKRCCDSLTEENRRLQKELQELRALKLSPQFYMQMAPPTTLTMCPSCERVAVPPPTSSSSSSPVVDHQRSHHFAAPPIHHHHHHKPLFPWAPIGSQPLDALRPRS